MWRAVKNNAHAVILSALGVGLVASQSVFAVTKIQTNICGDFLKPTILSPLTNFETHDAATLVTGSAQPYLAVAITVNGAVNGITTAAGDGTYALQVSLSVGDNTLVASDGNGCGITKDSDSIVVHRSEQTVPVTPEPVAAEPVTSTLQGQSSTSLAVVLPHALEQPLVESPASPGFATPTIRQPTPNEAYTASRVWVVGVAAPDSIVTIYVNGTSVAKVSASSQGNYAAAVELHVGKNTLQVKAEKNGLTAFSKKIEVTLAEESSAAPAPSVGTVLTVAAVTTTTVAAGVGGITWTVRRIRVRLK